jgi:hypothetical protein
MTIGVISTAWAVAPHPGKVYRGYGRECMNNTRDHTYTYCLPVRPVVSFRVSSNGRRVLNFVGVYDYYCGTGRSSVNAPSINITPGGRFSISGTWPDRLSNGRIIGTNHALITGSFTNTGKAAVVHYRWWLPGAGYPAGQTCGTDVTATLQASR